MQVKLNKSSVEAFLSKNQIWGKTLNMYIHSDFEKFLSSSAGIQSWE